MLNFKSIMFLHCRFYSILKLLKQIESSFEGNQVIAAKETAKGVVEKLKDFKEDCFMDEVSKLEQIFLRLRFVTT